MNNIKPVSINWIAKERMALKYPSNEFSTPLSHTLLTKSHIEYAQAPTQKSCKREKRRRQI